MASISKFYLHQADQTISGTPPGSTSLSASTPTVSLSSSWVNRKMDGTLGTGWYGSSFTTQATKSAQTCWHRRWCSDPLGAQTISAQNISFHICAYQSSTNVNGYVAQGVLAVYRPSTGSLVGRIFDTASMYALSGTGQNAASGTISGSSVTAQAGDILVFECWTMATQSMATAYTWSTIYNGTVEDGTSYNNAAYINFTNAVTIEEPVLPPLIVPATSVKNPTITNRPAAAPFLIQALGGAGGSVVAEDSFTRSVSAAYFSGFDGRGACAGTSSPTGTSYNFLWSFGWNGYGAGWNWAIAVDGSRASMILTTTGSAGGAYNQYFGAFGQSAAPGAQGRSVVQGKFTLPDPNQWTDHTYAGFGLGVTSVYTQYSPGYPAGSWPTFPKAEVTRYADGLRLYVNDYQGWGGAGPQADAPLSVSSGACTFWIKMQHSNLLFSAKFWLDGDDEPDDWMVEGTYSSTYYPRGFDILGTANQGPVVFMEYDTNGEYAGDVTVPTYYVDDLKMWNDVPPSVYAPGVEHVIGGANPYPYIGGGYYG